MKHIQTLLKLVLLAVLFCTGPSLWGQGTVQDIIDKGMDYMAYGKKAEALVQFESAIALDPKREPELRPYIEFCKPSKTPSKPRPNNEPSIFKLSTDKLSFEGIPTEETVEVTCSKGDWNVQSLADWCKILVVDKSFLDVTMTCEKNFSGRVRRTFVSFANDTGDGYGTQLLVQIRQKSEEEILNVKSNYQWKNPKKQNVLELEATGDLVIVDLDCNTEWQVVHQPDGVEVDNDNGDMTKLVVKVPNINSFGKGALNTFNKIAKVIEKDYITIETVNQGKRLTIQTEKPKLGKTDEEKAEEDRIREEKQAEKDRIKEEKQTEKDMDKAAQAEAKGAAKASKKSKDKK